jgi:hypothetical protein
MGAITGMTSQHNRIPSGGWGQEHFCSVNRNGIVTKKNSGQIKMYEVANSYFWEFEQLQTATGTTRRPVVRSKLPFADKSLQSNFIGESTFSTYEDCISQAKDAVTKLVERTSRADEELLRSYGE